MVPPMSPLAFRRSSTLPRIHSVISPTTGSWQGPNSVELAPGRLAQVPGGLDHRHLHAEADAKISHVPPTREARRLDLAFRAALAEAAGHQYPMHALEVLDRVLALEHL